MKTTYLDVETSPHLCYSWNLWNATIGPSQVVSPSRLLCAAWAVDDGAPRFVSEWTTGRDAMLDRLWNVLDKTDTLVTYNGASFDEKVLYREFLQAGMPPPSTFATIDLYRAVRARFRFASNKLDAVLGELELPGKVKTDFGLWRDVLDGKVAAQRKMRRYNLADVRILPALYKRLLPWLPSHPNVALLNGVPDGCVHCGSTAMKKNGRAYTATGAYQRYRCSGCGAQLRGSKALSTSTMRRA